MIDPVAPMRRGLDALARRRALWRRLSEVPAEVDEQARTQEVQAGELGMLGDAHHDTRLLAGHAATVAGEALAGAADLRAWLTTLDERTDGTAERDAVLHSHEVRLDRLERQLSVIWFTRLLEHTTVDEDHLVSVVMPTYNRAHLLPAAIESVLAQRYSRWELVIVDDGSTDDTAAVLARYDDPRIRTFRTANRGASAARNRALEEIRGELVAYLDSDNRLDEGWLAAVVWAFTTCPDDHTVYGARVIDHPERVYGPEVGPFPVLQFEPFDRATLEKGNFADMGVIAHRCRPDLRFDESLIWFGDWDLLLQLTADRPPRELPAVAVYYAAGPADRLTPVAGQPISSAVADDRQRVLDRHRRGPR